MKWCPMASMYLLKNPIITQITNFELSIGSNFVRAARHAGILTAKVWRRPVDTTEIKGKLRPHFNTRLCISTAEYSQMLCMTGSDYHMLKKSQKNMNKIH